MESIRIESLYQDLKDRIEFLRGNLGRVEEYAELVAKALKDGGTHYGINTGFGALATTRIEIDSVRQLQKNLLRSHAVGVGPNVPKELSRLMLELKIHAIGLGHSGVSKQTFERLLVMASNNLIPVVPEQGSVGASGDLAPLAHLALPLIGEGWVWDEDGRKPRSAKEVLVQRKLKPLELQAKEGLALTNGTQFMCAYGVYVLEQSKRLVQHCDLIGAMSLDALKGSARPFDSRVVKVRPHPGHAESASNIWTLLKGSKILESHAGCGKVQDPYSLRCMAVVHGASREALKHALEVLEREINSVTDNPLVFEDGDIISAGNFHGQPVALALDYAAIALSELASISERRSYLLLKGRDGLPRLLLNDVGLNSGYMIPQYTQAALVSENKILAHPASVDSIPTSLGQEDHVSMGSISAVKLLRVLNNVQHVLGLELLLAAQGLDFREPLRSSDAICAVHERVRERIPHRECDTDFQIDFQNAFQLIRGKELIGAAESKVGRLR